MTTYPQPTLSPLLLRSLSLPHYPHPNKGSTGASYLSGGLKSRLRLGSTDTE